MTSQKLASFNVPLKHAITESGMTQRVIAKRARIDETRLSRIVRQQVSPFDREKKALARVLGSTVESLFVTPSADAGASEERLAS